jgi:hypothetical protein
VALTTASASVNNVAVLNALGSKLPTAALPDNGPSGVTVTGLPIFPPYNNVGGLTWLSCEVDGYVLQFFNPKFFSKTTYFVII